MEENQKKIEEQQRKMVSVKLDREQRSYPCFKGVEGILGGGKDVLGKERMTARHADMYYRQGLMHLLSLPV